MSCKNLVRFVACVCRFPCVMLPMLLVSFQPQVFAVSVDQLAPSFVLPDIQDGKLIQLEQYRGKVIYLDFWATWCLPCRQSIPVLSNLHQSYSQKGFEVVAINVDKDLVKAKKFINEYSINYPVIVAEGSQVSELYNVNVMPTAYIIDRKGFIRLVHLGFKKEHSEFIDAIIQKLLAE